jgi:hypothetical protein
MATTANWESLSIQIPGQELLDKARNVLETLMVFLEVLKTILETVKVFLVDFGNPIKALVEALIQLILALFNALQRTGIYAWWDVPDPQTDPTLKRVSGGYQGFTTRFKAGLQDSRDPNRPQPIAGLTNSGFVLLVVDSTSIEDLLNGIQTLLRFFGREFLTPQYAAPADVKVLPLGGDGDPILSIVKLFQDQPKSVVVEWSLPPASNPGDPGFSDLIQEASLNFLPPRFLIEKSEVNPATGEVDVSLLSDPDAVGQVVATVPTKFEGRGQPGVILSQQVRILDNYQDPVVKFQKYIVIDTSTNTSTFLLGQLGTFRYIDNDVELNKTYYYRVRAYSGSLAVVNDSVTFGLPETNVIDQTPYIVWPGTEPSKPPVMGKASPTASIMIPVYPEKFDVIEVLNRLFQTAFSLNFHLPLPKGAKFDPSGAHLEPYTVGSDVGKSSLTTLAGPLTSFEAIPLVGAGSNVLAVTAAFQPDPVTGLLPVLPWNESLVRRNASRLAITVAGAMLQANNALVFKEYMEGDFPKGIPPSSTTLKATNLKELVYEITKVQDPNLSGQGGVQTAGVLYGNLFTDDIVRLNVLAAVNFCKTFTLGGAPPDWIQVSFLRDIVPWSAQLLYELLAKMQALLDAYSGVIDEIKAFIDLIIRKINVLEGFLEYLISLLNFIESLALPVYILSVPQTSGDSNEWASIIDNAGGTPPPSGPTGYSAGVSLAYVAVDIGPFSEAFSLIF